MGTARKTMKLTISLLCLQGSQQVLSLAASNTTKTTTTTTTTTTLSSRVVMESLKGAPPGWTVLGPAPGHHTIRLSVALASSAGREQLDHELHQISDPDHRRYGQHFSRDEAWALLGPRQEAVESVRGWLASAARLPEDEVRHRGHVLEATVRVRDAEALLAARYGVFGRDGGGGGGGGRHTQRVVGTLAYSVPAHLRPHIASIQPTTFLSGPDPPTHMHRLERRHQPQRAEQPEPDMDTATATATDTCATLNTPACLRRLYGITSRAARPDPRSLLGVVGFNK
ncbi:hypothetical protein E4U43_004995 [Claviceps pusilla]|uniref:Peptidase S53 activation domain-containing protein n=1 Tax=Claviceps pusilla TaxID=123648 RepID=A0A9P7N3D8_9HYPO|nr:hypothetical protein E4U43_004995 [Claviceps pusilla]